MWNGEDEEVYERACSSTSPDSIMFPKAPIYQKYVDANPLGKDKDRQTDYEMEVVMYRALEGLQNHLKVLHSFNFEYNNKNGQCDFLVFGTNYIVVIEVKNWDISASLEDSKTFFEKSLEQRCKILLYIAERTNTTVFDFAAFPNVSRKAFTDHVGNSLTDEVEMSRIIFQDDILRPKSQAISLTDQASVSTSSVEEIEENLEEITFDCWSDKISHFSKWWDKKISNKVLSSAPMSPEILHGFLRTWCSNDLSKLSLGKCIMDIDRDVNTGLITFAKTNKGKKRPPNPEVREAPREISEYLGIHYLTQELYDVFYSGEKMLWIEGVAGSGKSVLLCGLIIKLALADEGKKVVLIRPISRGATNLYETALKKAQIPFYQQPFELMNNRMTISEFQEFISQNDCRVIILYADSHTSQGFDRLLDQISVLCHSHDHVYIDDIQDLFLHLSDECGCKFVDKLLEFSPTNTIRVACDVGQHSGPLIPDLFSLRFLNELSERNLTILSTNLRNTRHISDVLSIFRNMMIDAWYGDSVPAILSQQIPGHFIHGPKVMFHILESKNLIKRVVNDELDKLFSIDDHLKNSDVSLIYDCDCGTLQQEFFECVVHTRSSDANNEIAVCDVVRVHSQQWPAVVVVKSVERATQEGEDDSRFKMFDDSHELVPLYLMLSRARVYCSVILYPALDSDKVEENRDVSLLLTELENIVSIKQHDERAYHEKLLLEFKEMVKKEPNKVYFIQGGKWCSRDKDD